MHRDRVEELLLLFVAFCLSLYLLPFSLARGILATLFIAVTLVLLLILRSMSWHEERVTPFDGVLIIGILLSVIHLVSFSAFQQNFVGTTVIVLFILFYLLMAVLLFQHRWLFGEQQTTRRVTARVHKRPSRLAHFFRRNHARDPEFQKGIEPIPEIPEDDHARDPMFKKGIEPIPDITRKKPVR